MEMKINGAYRKPSWDFHAIKPGAPPASCYISSSFQDPGYS